MTQPNEIGYIGTQRGDLVRLAWYPHGEIPIPRHGADVRTDGKLVMVAALVATHERHTAHLSLRRQRRLGPSAHQPLDTLPARSEKGTSGQDCGSPQGSRRQTEPSVRYPSRRGLFIAACNFIRKWYAAMPPIGT